MEALVAALVLVATFAGAAWWFLGPQAPPEASEPPPPPAPPPPPPPPPTPEEVGKKLLAWHLGTIATDYIDRLRACPACDHRLTRKSANYRSHSTMNGGWALHDLTLSCGGCGWTHTVRDALEHASPPPKRPPKPGSAPLGPRRGWQIGLRATQPGMPVPLGMVTSPVRVVFATVWAGGGEDTEVEPDPSLPDRGRMAVALSRLLIDRAVRVELPDVEDPEALRLAAVRQELLGGSVLELVEG